MNTGILFGIGAYLLWGFLPIYWKAFEGIPALEILCHRMAWSLLFSFFILGIQNHWRWIKSAVHDWRVIVTFLVTAALLSVNWYTYIWAVRSGYIVESSLGYFINPLINVILGVVLLREKMRFVQWIAVGIAGAGVIYLTVSYGSFPWIAFVLAFTFGFYGLIRKTASLNAIEGLTCETAVMFIPALCYLLFLEFHHDASFLHVSTKQNLLLSFTGVATALPLLWFAIAARKIDLSKLGFLQYIAPSLQFLLGVFLYKEHFNQTRLIGFTFIWTALVIFSVEEFLNYKKKSTNEHTLS